MDIVAIRRRAFPQVRSRFLLDGAVSVPASRCLLVFWWCAVVGVRGASTGRRRLAVSPTVVAACGRVMVKTSRWGCSWPCPSVFPARFWIPNRPLARPEGTFHPMETGGSVDVAMRASAIAPRPGLASGDIAYPGRVRR